MESDMVQVGSLVADFFGDVYVVEWTGNIGGEASVRARHQRDPRHSRVFRGKSSLRVVKPAA